MKPFAVVPLAASLVFLTGCTAAGDYFGSEASGARASSARTSASSARVQCDITAPTVTGPLFTGGTPPEEDPAPAATLAVMVSRTTDASTAYSIQLVDTNGQTVASIKAHTRSHIKSACLTATTPIPAGALMSSSAGRVYYLDGDTDVRYLAPDGSSGLATKVPGSSQSLVLFAVSPDDSKIAVAVFDFSWRPVLARLYIEDLKSKNRVEITDASGGYWGPIGWHDGKLLADDGLASSLHLLDPNTGRSLQTIGGPTCQPIASLPTPAGFACFTPSRGVGRIDWSGNVTIFATSDSFIGGASLSPDGTQLLASGTGAVLKTIDSPQAGSGVTSLGSTYGYPGGGGWLDDFHAVFQVAGTTDQAVIDIRNRSVVPLPAGSALEARLPGGY